MKHVFRMVGATLVLAAFSCAQPQSDEQPADSMKIANDIHSFARPEEARVTHLDLTLNVDFETKKLTGVAKYLVDVQAGAEEIIFDTRGLTIESVSLSDGSSVEFQIGAEQAFLGQPLHIPVNQDITSVEIQYATAPGADALQWLSPEQTAQKQHPFLFTQSQAILARTWIPCQDSPGIRFTYNAVVTVPKDLMAVMSAENPKEKNDTGVYSFKMEQPIPSYLMALSVGDLEFASLGERTGVYAEAPLLEKSVYEFAEMETMLESAEKIYGKYAWGRYDLIVLPPSFPFGGMENPRLTFATPTIIAGDRSLTSLVAHELAHSWSGNLVTNATWNDFWLNEGFTVYFEQRIMEEVYGREYSEMLALLSYQGLTEEIKEISEKNPADTKLKLDLDGRDPDDGMSAIAYDKGYLFLRKIEETIGRERFDQFLKSYFATNAFKVMDTEQFLDLLSTDLLSAEEATAVNVDAWVYGEGLPEGHPNIQSERFDNVEKEISRWMDGAPANELGTSEWSTHEWLHFINNLPEDLDLKSIAALDEAFGLTESGNNEILAAWFQVTIRGNYAPADTAVERFLITVGRRKFLTPTYKALIEADPTKERARAIYQKARPNYHSVSTHTMDELLDWGEAS